MNTPTESKSEIIAFASGKGGTGKTSIAAALGYALTRSGHKVLLIDGDRATDGFSLFILGPDGMLQTSALKQENTFTGVLERFEKTSKISFERFEVNRSELSDHGIRYDALLSASDVYGDQTDVEEISYNRIIPRPAFQTGVIQLFHELKSKGYYDYVLVDTRGGFSYESTDLLAAADSFILVTEATNSNYFQDRNLLAKIALAGERLNLKPLLRAVIVNKVIGGEGPSFIHELSTGFSIKPERIYILHLDIEAATAYKLQKVIYREAPASLFAVESLRAFKQIIRIVTSQWPKERADKWNDIVAEVNKAVDDHNAKAKEEKARIEAEIMRMEATGNEALRLRSELTSLKTTMEGEAERQRLLVAELKEHAAVREGMLSGASKVHQAMASRWFACFMALCVVCLGALIAGSLLATQQWERIAETENRSKYFVHKAQVELDSKAPNSKETALHFLSIALHLNPRNADAAQLTCDLILSNRWCPPLSPELRFPSIYNPFIAAAFTPDDRVCAVSSDGKLLGSTENDRQFAQSQILSPSPTDKRFTSSSLPRTLVASASFSPSAEQLLIIPTSAAPTPSPTAESTKRGVPGAGSKTTQSKPEAPNPVSNTSGDDTVPVPGQMWRWSSVSRAYEPMGNTLAITAAKGSIFAFRTISWKSDGTICIVPTMLNNWTNAACEVFCLNNDSYAPLLDPFPGECVCTAAFSPDDKWVATGSVNGEMQIWDWNDKEKNFTRSSSTPDRAVTTKVPQKPSNMTISPSGDIVISVFGKGAYVWNPRNGGDPKLLSFPSVTDQFVRYTYSPRKSAIQLAAGSTTGRVFLTKQDDLGHEITEPIWFGGSIANVCFSKAGLRLATCSGSFYNALDTVRIWDLSRAVARTTALAPQDVATIRAKGAPPWLGDVARAVSGVSSNSEYDESSFLSLEDVRRKYAVEAMNGPYAALWKLVFPDFQ